MSPHIHDELPLLLTGEADRATADAATAHLRECEDCRGELISALVAHAALSSAAKVAPTIAAPPARAEPPPAPEPAEAPTEPASDLPDLTSLFSQVRHEADTRVAAGSRRWRARWLAAAAVAGLALGGGAVTLAEHASSGPSGRSVALAPYDHGHTAATAKIVDGDQMRVDATTLPTPPSGKRYEVWLTDAARQHMQPLGWVGANGKTDLTVPVDLMNRFSAIEVSVQDVNAPYLYSGVSVLRGSYR